MTGLSNFHRTASWLNACGKNPTNENLSVQIGCDMEEACEFFKTVEFENASDTLIVARALIDLEWIAEKLKRGDATAFIPHEKRAEALDALCDREVTGNGVAYFAGFDKEGADQAVLAANDAKLVDGKPVLLPGGKIGKPEGWTPPDHSMRV